MSVAGQLSRWWFRWRTPFLLVAISAVLMRLSFPRPGWGWLAWIGLVGFFLSLEGKRWREAFFLGWLFGFLFFYSNLFWLNTLIAFNPFIPFGILLLGGVLGLALGIFALLYSLGKGLGWFRPWWVAALWVGIEYLRSIGPLGFPWVLVGLTQYRFAQLIQVVDIGGIWILSFVVVMCNWSLSHLIMERSVSKWSRRIPLVVLLVLVLLLLTYGRYAKSRDYGTTRSLRVGLVQPSVEQMKKLRSYAHPDESIRTELQQQILGQLISLVKSFEPGELDLIVCPETALTHPGFTQDTDLHRVLHRMSEQLECPLFLGADNFKPLSTELNSRSDFHIYNSVWLVTPEQGLVAEPYNKIQLVPFGEYIPFFGTIPFIRESIINIGDFDRGTRYRVFEYGDTRFCSLICFESTFPWLLREFVRHGAEMTIVVTNDAWYGRSSGAYQHTVQSIFRAIEFRRPLVRCANHGISCFIDPYGQVEESLGLYKIGTLSHQVNPCSWKTLYMRYGDWWAYVCLGLSFVGLGIVALKPRREEDAGEPSV